MESYTKKKYLKREILKEKYTKKHTWNDIHE